MVNTSPLLDQPPFGTKAREPPRIISSEEREKTKHLTRCERIMVVVVVLFMVLFSVFFFVILHEPFDGGIPVVKIRSVHVSLHNESTYPANFMISKWNISITIENKNPRVTFIYSDFDVSVDQAKTWRSTLGIIPGFRQDSSHQTVHFNTTVLALLPSFNANVFDLPFRVTFLSDVKVVSTYTKMFFVSNKAELFRGRCTGIKIRVNGTYGSMSGPVTCTHKN